MHVWSKNQRAYWRWENVSKSELHWMSVLWGDPDRVWVLVVHFVDVGVHPRQVEESVGTVESHILAKHAEEYRAGEGQGWWYILSIHIVLFESRRVGHRNEKNQWHDIAIEKADQNRFFNKKPPAFRVLVPGPGLFPVSLVPFYAWELILVVDVVY